MRALTHGERLVGILWLYGTAGSGPAALLGPVHTDELNPLRLFLDLFCKEARGKLMGWRRGTGRQGALYLQVSEGDADGAAQVRSGRVGHHHRHDSGDQLDVRRHAVLLVAAELLQGLVGGGGEVGVAQQGSVGEACKEKTWLETAGWGCGEEEQRGSAEEEEEEKEEGGRRRKR